MILPGLDAAGDISLKGGTSRADATGGTASGMFNNSGFTVNYGPSVGGVGGASPSWVWLAVAVMAGVWILRRR